jgi:hypothetical protein
VPWLQCEACTRRRRRAPSIHRRQSLPYGFRLITEPAANRHASALWGHRVAACLGNALGRLHRSSGSRWLTTFVLLSALGGLWAVANPLFSGPDEAAHVAHAAAIARGQLTGDAPRSQTERKKHILFVRIPASFDVNKSVGCFATRPDTPAGCLSVTRSTKTAPVITGAGRSPPVYYALIGWVSLIKPAAAPATYLMRLISLLMGAAFVACAVNGIWRLGAARLGGLGIAVAMTPMVLFTLGIVNPSGLEITSALALWACGSALVVEAENRVDRGLVAQVGIAAITLAVARQLGPLWLGLIVLTLAATASSRALLRIARSRAARVWLAAATVAAGAQIAWLVIVKPLETVGGGLRLTPTDINRFVVGRGYSIFLDMIGRFGWLDTAPPSATWAFWMLAIGGLVVFAFMSSRTRLLWAMVATALLTVAIPMAVEAREAGHTGIFWQGRYTLPLAIGVPILAAIALIRSDRGTTLESSALFPFLGALIVVAQALAYAQNLRRYMVGRNGPIQFWKGGAWKPPIPALLLLIAFTATMTALTVWLLGQRRVILEVEHSQGAFQPRGMEVATSEVGV